MSFILRKYLSNILAIESSTSQCSVALRTPNSISERKIDAIGTHSSAIFTQIDDLLCQNGLTLSDIQAIIVARGPGSYTGLRVAVSAIKGLLFGRDIIFYSANTLASFAASISVTNEILRVHSIIDARRKHIYWQKFEVSEQKITPINEHCIIEIESIYSKIKPGDYIIGTGLERLNPSEMINVTMLTIEHTGAKGLFRVFEYADQSLIKLEKIQDFEPVYVTSEV
jgi:tRNA threonylcarbamoyladenosine biosynthesis protein TsaB